MRGRLSVVRGIGVVVAAACVVSLPAGAADGFDPASTSVTVVAGASATLEQTLHLDALPQEADVVIAIDTTGSMGSAIADARADAVAIVDELKASIPGVRFAVVDFEDYPIAPYGQPTDVPYLLRRGFTSSAAEVQAAFDAMDAPAGSGGDAPEAHNRLFYETYSDPDLAWDAQATRILIALTDTEGIPRDTDQATSFPACPNTAGVDPGPDGIEGNGDDLDTKTVIDGLIGANTTLSVITYDTSPNTPACLKELAEATGGSQVARADRESLLALIKELVTEQAKRIDGITFRHDAPEGWTISFDPEGFGAQTAPVDLGVSETIEVPKDAAAGVYEITVTALVNGAERATHTLTVDVVKLGGLELTVDRRSVRAGIASFPPSVVPANRIPFFGGASIDSAPVGSIPVGSIPVGSVPVGSVPVGSIPVGSVPVGSIPVGSIPVGSIGLLSLPVGSVPMVSVPVGSIPVGSVGLEGILLSALPLAPSSGTTWDEILAGTTLADRPLQTLTLNDVAELALSDVAENVAALERFNALTLQDVPFLASLLRNVKLASVLLGEATLDEIPPPGGAASWDALLADSGGNATGVNETTNTVLGLDLAGRLGSTPVGSIPVGSVPVGSVPVGSIPVGSVPVGSVPVGSIDLRRTRLAGVLVSVLDANRDDVVDCSGGYCTATRTLGEAWADGRVKATATVADLKLALDETEITIAELIAAMIGLENYPWHLVPLVGLQDAAGTGDNPRYTVEFDLACSLPPSLSSVKLALPPGFVPVSGSASWTFDEAAPVTGPDASEVTSEERVGFEWVPPANECGESGVQHVVFQVDAYAGLDLGDFTASATATAGATSLSVSGQAPVLVLQNHEANDAEASATTVEKNRVYAFHVASAGDKEVFSLPIPARNTNTKISLNVPDGADFDLVVGKPEAVALNSAPVGSVPVGSVPVGSVPLPDEGATANDATRSPQPDTLQDIPVGSVPVGSVSANRGSADEALQLVSQGETGRYTVTVSGYNGSHSTKPATLYVTETPPPPLPSCSARRFPFSSTTFGALPTSLPVGTKTLFLLNRNQMTRLHGKTAVENLLKDIGSQTTPGKLAARPEILGSVLEIDGATAVRNAYAAWNTTPCSVDAANAVVRAANDVVGSLLASQSSLKSSLKYIVLLGSDEVVPSGRVPDPVLISPELDNASDLAFTTANLTNGNAQYAAAATNQILTDAVYGAFTTIPWLGRQLNLPQVPVSRLLESPAEIQGQLAQYKDSNGLLQPSSAYVTGYDFLRDGAEDVRDGLAAGLGLTPMTDINDSWDKTTVQNRFFGASPAPAVGSLNAHYNHYLAQPAAATTAAGLFSTSIVPSLPGRVLFTMGCHGGLNVADSLLTGTLPPDALDWAQAYARARVAVYVANYTFGYGDTEAAALSERLMALFAARVGADNRSLAEQWVDSLHTYFATAGTAYGVYDEKVMIGANLMGPPWYRTGKPAAAPPETTSTTTVDGMTFASLNLSLQDSTTQIGTGSGGGPTYWQGESVLATHYRPLQPVVSKLINPAAGTPPARGIFITGLATHDVPDVTPVLARPTVDLSAHEPPASFDETFFPANYVLLARTGLQTRAVVSAGQFRPIPGSDRGTQRLVDSISFDVAFGAQDGAPPQISQVGAITIPTGIRVFVRAADAFGFRRAAVLINDGAAAWRLEALTAQGGGLFTADVAGTTQSEILAQVENLRGFTAYSTKKGENFNPIVAPSGEIEILVDSPRPSHVYSVNQVVVPRFSCSSEASIQTCSGSSPTVDTSTPGTHTYTVTATDLANRETIESVEYVVMPASFATSFQGFFSPVQNPPTLNRAKAGSVIPLKFGLGDDFGLDIFPETDLPASFEFNCTTLAPMGPLEAISPGNRTLSYNASLGQYSFGWQTLATWAGQCRQFVMTLFDGTVKRANFKLTK